MGGVGAQPVASFHAFSGVRTAAGSVYVSIHDYAKFIALWFTGKEPALLDRRSLNELITPDSGRYAAGWFVLRRDWAQGIVLRHSGSNGSWSTRVEVGPEPRNHVHGVRQCP